MIIFMSISPLSRLQDSIKESIAMTMKDELLGALEERSSSHNQQQQVNPSLL